MICELPVSHLVFLAISVIPRAFETLPLATIYPVKAGDDHSPVFYIFDFG